MNLVAVVSMIAATLIPSVKARVGTKEVSFGAMRLELHSTSSSEASPLLAELVTRTSTFLDKKLQTYFSESLFDEYYSHTVLRVVDFKIEQTDDLLYSTIVDFGGSSFFGSVPLPGAGFIISLFKDAFQGDSRQDYVRDLQSSNIPFLTDVSYLVVEMNNQVIASEDVTNNDSSGSSFLSTESMALIIAGASLAALAFCLAAVVFFCYKRSEKASKLRVTTIQSNQDTFEDLEYPAYSPHRSLLFARRSQANSPTIPALFIPLLVHFLHSQWIQIQYHRTSPPSTWTMRTESILAPGRDKTL
ncbi:hypothetical protein MHU86_7062 [Fragilaria crotonensis]|nr:hypothetical protein MHU86_7062 [Fragilaria crotonensis]